MKKCFKRALTIVLALTMVLTMMNVSVAAAAATEVATADQLTAAIANGGEIKLTADIAVDADTTIRIASGKTLTLDLGGFTLSGESDVSTSNRNMFDVRGVMYVSNGTITLKHVGTNMGWNSSTNIFHVEGGGELYIENATLENLGGSDMNFCVHLNNWGEVTLEAENTVFKATYCPIRVFNSGYDDNNVTLKYCDVISGGNRAFWVHNYMGDFSDPRHTEDAVNARLKFDILDCSNHYELSSTATVEPIRYGFKNTVFFSADSHTAVVIPGEYSNCTEEGLTDGSECSVCGKVLVEQETIIALGHTGDHDIAKEPSCEADGNIEYWFCTVCGIFATDAEYTDIIDEEEIVDPATGHNATHFEAVVPTCTGDGNYEYWYCDACDTYAFNKEFTQIITGIDDIVDSATGHTGDHDIAREPSCEADGNIEYWFCTVCGIFATDAEYTNIITEDEIVDPAHGHNATHFEAVVPTCTGDGNYEYWYCDACDTYAFNKEFTQIITLEGTVVPSEGHNAVFTEAVDATCTEDGNFSYWYCDICDTYATEDTLTEVITEERIVIPATGHITLTEIPAVEATCTTDGATAGEKCADCGTVTKTPQVVSAVHNEYNMRDKKATCATDGSTGGVGCYDCGEIVVEPTVIPATGHTAVAVAGKDATCTETGLTAGEKCSVCGNTTVAQTTIAKLAHKYVDGKCSVCGEAQETASQPTTSSTTTSAPTTSSTAPVVPSEPIVTSDGTTIKTDGSYVVADGTVVENDGTIVKTDGTVIKPDEAVAEIEETIVKVEDEEEIKEAIPMTQEEEAKVAAEGAKVEVWVEVKDASATVNEETKKLITDAMEENRVGMFLDVDMFKQVVGKNETASTEKATQLTKLNEKVTVSFELPKALIAPTTAVERQYFIVRVHEGVAELIPAKFDAATGKLSFETDRFSNYAVVYTDTVKVDVVVPSTGNPANNAVWMGVLLMAAGAALVLKKKQSMNA